MLAYTITGIKYYRDQKNSVQQVKQQKNMIHRRTLESLDFDKVKNFLSDQCITSVGREKALNLNPLDDREQINLTFTLYEESCVWEESAEKSFVFTSFPDVRSILDDAEKKARHLDSEGFWGLREMLRLAQNALASIDNAEGFLHWPHLVALAKKEPFPQQITAALNRCIADDGYFRDESSPELFRIRSELRKLHQNCLRKVKEFAQQYNISAYLQDDFMTISSDRYVLPLKANFKGRLQGIIHDWSQTGETCYFEPIFLVEINNRLQELKREEHAEERNLLLYLGNLLISEIAGVRSALDLLTEIDVLRAKRIFSASLGCNCVTLVSESDGLELINARHPLLALARQDLSGKDTPVVPQNITLRPGERALVITGGNAGGKTVCLKTLGLMIAMTLSGLPVPADAGSHMPMFGRMDAFIGDEQNLEQNVSTFTAQIDHLAKAWKHLDNQGIVLLDEFGAGTDPAEGSALAQAVLDGLLDKQCFIACATHFPALKAYALAKPGVRAASMLFDEANKPLFMLAYDQVGASRALAVAREHHLPEDILRNAEHYLLQSNEDYDALLEKLNSLAKEREQEIQKLRVEQRKVKEDYARKLEKLEKEKQAINDEIRARISDLMQQVRSGKAGPKKTMREMSGLRAQLFPEATQESVLPEPGKLEIGQKVMHVGLRKKGYITELDTRKGRVRLSLDGVNIWTAIKDVRCGPETSEMKAPGKVSSSLKVLRTPALSLDVRGMRTEEAISEVETFLDQAILSGFNEVEIIHGRGTGALRKQIHDFLRYYPQKINVSLAPEDRGGDGVTILRFD